MEEDKISKSFTEYNQTKVAHLKRVQELSVKVEDKWHTEATEVSLSEKDEILHAYNAHDRKANYSDLKNKKMMVFKIELPAEYLVTCIKFNFNSIDALKLIYNIEAYSELTNTKQSFIRPLESQKIVTIDPMLKFLSINLYSFASIIYIYYQPMIGGIDSDGPVTKKNKNVFSYNGPLHDLNAEIQKSNIKANDLDELDNEVAMISRKFPKTQTTQGKDESDKSKQPSSNDDKSENSNSDSQVEESKQPPSSAVISSDNQTDESGAKTSMITSISISGAKGLQSKINLIPLFNIKTLFQR